MKTKKPSLLYRLFDSNVYGKFSQVSLFFGALSLVAGQFVGAGILIGLGGLALGASIAKNISDAKAQKKYRQQMEEISYEEYVPQNETQAQNTASQVKTYETQTTSNKNNSNERSL